MKVYVVIDMSDFDGRDLVAIFATKEEAEAEAAKREDAEVEEWTVGEMRK